MREYFLKTERVSFSRWNTDDYSLAESIWGDKQVAKFISANGSFSEREIRERLQAEIQNQTKYGVQYWPVFCVRTNDFIGCGGLRPYQFNNGIYEIGFHLRTKYWGNGYGTEVAQAVIRYAFDILKVSNLFAGHNPNNLGSARLLTKLGFHYVNDEYYAPTGLYHPSYLYHASSALVPEG